MQEGGKHLINFDKYAKYVNSLLYFWMPKSWKVVSVGRSTLYLFSYNKILAVQFNPGNQRMLPSPSYTDVHYFIFWPVLDTLLVKKRYEENICFDACLSRATYTF